MGNFFTLLIIGIIVIYCIYVIARRMKQIKNGQYCSCGCSDCPSKCHKPKEPFKEQKASDGPLQ